MTLVRFFVCLLALSRKDEWPYPQTLFRPYTQWDSLAALNYQAYSNNLLFFLGTLLDVPVSFFE